MMAKRFAGGLLVGALLFCTAGIAQQAVVLPPAEEEVTVLEEAFSQVEDFFRGFIVEMKTSLTTLGARVEELGRTSLVFQMGLEELAERLLDQDRQITELGSRLTAVEQAIEGGIGPKIMDLDGRMSALEGYDFASFERRLGALDKAYEALSVRIDNNRAKIEGLEAAFAATSASLDERLAVAEEVQIEAASQREEIEALKTELAQLAEAEQAQWSAIFLVPIVVGGLLFLLLSS